MLHSPQLASCFHRRDGTCLLEGRIAFPEAHVHLRVQMVAPVRCAPVMRARSGRAIRQHVSRELSFASTARDAGRHGAQRNCKRLCALVGVAVRRCGMKQRPHARAQSGHGFVRCALFARFALWCHCTGCRHCDGACQSHVAAAQR